ncbi:unnamed protein product [Notodromas monacha]|uniref:Uncharacterized protein n=1 Tax=Notodromas monacha TaxID=399045 RepID=A0A7R9BZT2_9CRUS|nr:unnamed protein product [Notodromas monacha]CAG0923705.1 unnamed protein product [Notodromas monacha]
MEKKLAATIQALTGTLTTTINHRKSEIGFLGEQGNDDSMRICYRVNGQPMTCAANTMCFTAYEDFRRAGNVVAKGCMTYLSPGCVNCPQSLMKHFPTGNNGPEKLPKLCCYCDFDGCNAEGIKFSSSIAAGLWASSYPTKVLAKGCMKHEFFGCEGCPLSLTNKFPYSTFPKDCCFCDWDLCNDGRLSGRPGPPPAMDPDLQSLPQELEGFAIARMVGYAGMTLGFLGYLAVSAFYKCLACADECLKPCPGEITLGDKDDQKAEDYEGEYEDA